MAALDHPRIAIVAASAPPYGAGGVASAHYNLWRALRKRGYEARLFTFYDNGIKKKPVKGIFRHGISPVWLKRFFMLLLLPWRILQPGKLAYQTAEILRNAPGAIKMARSIQRFAPDIVVLSDHGAPGLWLPKSPRQRFILVSHHNPARIAKESGLGEFSVLDTRLAIWLEDQVLKKVDHVLCPSAYIRKWFTQTYKFRGAINVVPNLVDLSTVDVIRPLNIRSELKLPAKAKIVYMPSAGSRIKGADYLVDILETLLARAKHPLGFYIPGQIEPKVMERLVSHPARDRILLSGQLSYDKHIAYVKASDICVSPARMENFSMAIVEAAYVGVPVVAFNRGGNGDIVSEGKNGYLVSRLNAKAIAECAAELLNSPKLTAMKRETKAHTRSKFSTEKVLDLYLNTFFLGNKHA